MLQRIFGGSEESEDSEPVRTRPPKKQRRLSSNEVPTFPEKTVKSPEDLLKEEICQEHRTTASGPDIGIEASLPLEPHISLRTTVESPSAPVAPVKRPMFKARCPEDEEKLACGLLGDPPDREDIVMLRLALGRMKGEGEELVGGVSWAYHPHDILSLVIVNVTSCCVCVSLTPPTAPWSPAHQAETTGLTGPGASHHRLCPLRGLLQD